MVFQDLVGLITDIVVVLDITLFLRGTSSRQVLGAQVGLQLFQQDQHQGNFVLLVKLFNGRFLYFFEVNVHILIAIPDVGSLLQQVVQELSHQEGCTLVFFTRTLNLFLLFLVVLLEELVLLLLSLQFVLNILKLVL